MKKTKLGEIMLASMLSFALFSCEPPSEEIGGSGNNNQTSADKPIEGTLTVAETWPGKDENEKPVTYYINSTYYVQNGGALTISEGAIVKFGPKGGITVNGGGSLVATKAVFTSSKDSRGRKILEAGDANPSAGDWKSLNISGGHAEFYECEIAYGGNGVNTINVKKNTSLPTCKIDGCLIRYNSGSESVANSVKAAVYYDKTVTYSSDNAVTNTTFENNVWPISLPPFFDVSGTNHFGTGEKANTYNLIHFYDEDITRDAVWEHQEVPYLYAASTNPLYVGYASNSGSLTIKGGTEGNPTVVEFFQKGINVYKNSGTLYLENYIHFTNCQYTPNTKYPGLHCAKEIIWHDYYTSGSVKTTYKETNPLLISNDTMHITIDGYEASAKYSTDADAANRQIVADAVNTFGTITLY